MKAIDADALNARIDKCVGIDGLGLEPVMAIRDIKALISVMPTSNAIPVEWIRSQLKNNPNDIESTYGDICLNELIDRWQEEQEAR